jgi:hypothetical protein
VLWYAFVVDKFTYVCCFVRYDDFATISVSIFFLRVWNIRGMFVGVKGWFGFLTIILTEFQVTDCMQYICINIYLLL